MENFSNSVLLPDHLPEIEKKAFNPLNKKYLTILFMRLFIFFLFVIGGFVAFVFLFDEEIPVLSLVIISSLVTVLAIYLSVITYFGFPRKGYLVREKDISFQKGLIIYKVTTVPFNRIQHVEVTQGVLAKAFKLSSIKLFTAGGTASDLSIPGLPCETAQNLKEFLSEKISEYE